MKETLREWKQTIGKHLRIFQFIASWTKSLWTLSWFFSLEKKQLPLAYVEISVSTMIGLNKIMIYKMFVYIRCIDVLDVLEPITKFINVLNNVTFIGML